MKPDVSLAHLKNGCAFSPLIVVISVIGKFIPKLTSQNFFLVDNGSLRPESILYIREIADDLNKSTGVSIIPSGIMSL